MRHGADAVARQAAPDPQLAAARLYVITPDATRERVLEVAAGAARGGADVVQLRHKSMPRGELLRLAHELRVLLKDTLFVVNDHVDIALLSGADGVHLGPEDLSFEAARQVAGERLLIGVSASTSDAVPIGADYVGCGPVFATPLKPQKQVVGPAWVAALSAALTIPVFAIGGIDASNIDQLIDVGVRRVCVIRAVGDATDPEAATRRLREIVDG